MKNEFERALIRLRDSNLSPEERKEALAVVGEFTLRAKENVGRLSEPLYIEKLTDALPGLRTQKGTRAPELLYVLRMLVFSYSAIVRRLEDGVKEEVPWETLTEAYELELAPGEDINMHVSHGMLAMISELFTEEDQNRSLKLSDADIDLTMRSAENSQWLDEDEE